MSKTLFIGVLIIHLNTVAQVNLIRNGKLSHYMVDSIYVQNKLYDTLRTGVMISDWDQNVCQQMYHPDYSFCSETFLNIVMYQTVAKDIFYVDNVYGILTTPLKENCQYILTLYAKPYSGNAFCNSLGAMFTKDTIDSDGYYDVNSKKSNTVTPSNLLVLQQVINDPHHFTAVSFTYTASGGERYIHIGNLSGRKPDKWQRTKAFGYFRNNISEYKKEWCMYAVSCMSLYKQECENDSTDSVVNIAPKDTLCCLPSIFFQTNDSKLSQDNIMILKQILGYLQEHPEVYVDIIGYTDDTGNYEDNMKLSSDRANSAKDFLVNLGINQDRLVVHAKGSTMPASKNDTDTKRQKNRRVEVLLRYDSKK